jgi:hypothetical protein
MDKEKELEGVALGLDILARATRREANLMKEIESILHRMSD